MLARKMYGNHLRKGIGIESVLYGAISQCPGDGDAKLLEQWVQKSQSAARPEPRKLRIRTCH